MSNSAGTVGEHWDAGWDEHKKRQLRRLARLPLIEKLDWLEEAQRVAASLSARGDNTRRRNNDPR